MTENQKARIRLYRRLMMENIRAERRMMRDALKRQSEGKIGRHMGGLAHWLGRVSND